MVTIKDSGSRTDFGTGSVRDLQDGKGRFDLLPWMSLWALAKHYEAGCKKYGDRNWEKGQTISSYVNSAMRHLAKFIFGYDDENHLIACAWNVLCAYETLIRVNEGLLPDRLDDLPYTFHDVGEIDPYGYECFHHGRGDENDLVRHITNHHHG